MELYLSMRSSFKRFRDFRDSPCTVNKLMIRQTDIYNSMLSESFGKAYENMINNC